jgi:hypothetical protein
MVVLTQLHPTVDLPQLELKVLQDFLETLHFKISISILKNEITNFELQNNKK